MSQRQLSFDLPVRTAHAREDFYVAPANAMAVALIDGWRDWPDRKLLLTGPAGSGKTHLTHVWAGLADATILSAASLSEADIPALATGAVAVEDVDIVAGDAAAETALFHLHNLVLAEGRALLMTGTGSPRDWGIGLPDLASRLSGTATVALAEPDDPLLGAVLVKLFADRQLVPTPDTLPYLVRWMPRSLADARAIVARMDDRAMAESRALNRALAREVLAAYRPSDPLDNSEI